MQRITAEGDIKGLQNYKFRIADASVSIQLKFIFGINSLRNLIG
jgi:hypothetical protein